MIEQVARTWEWSAGEIQQLIEEAEDFTATRSIGDDNDQAEMSISARLLMRAESILSQSLVNKLAEIAPQNVGRRIEQLRREILLAGPEYDDAIRQCAAIATEDYKFAEVALKGVWSALYNLGKSIQYQLEAFQSKTSGKEQAKTAAEVAKQLETTRKALTVEIIKEIESVRESLSAKQRALNHFSIAFMGKTKAGKSTLHAIITSEGWDAIGVGKQRTTRLNRLYEWKNIRIIDTPGIGAPSGKTDEEIAQSVIEESDVICYVVTNDSIQETEFGFLRVLNAYQETSQKFNKEVQEAIEEVGNELQLVAQLDSGKFSFTEQDSNNFVRDWLRIGGSVMGIAATIITFFAPPVGLAMGIAAGVVGTIAGLFKSKDQKRREAVQNISSSLAIQLN